MNKPRLSAGPTGLNKPLTLAASVVAAAAMIANIVACGARSALNETGATGDLDTDSSAEGGGGGGLGGGGVGGGSGEGGGNETGGGGAGGSVLDGGSDAQVDAAAFCDLKIQEDPSMANKSVQVGEQGVTWFCVEAIPSCEIALEGFTVYKGGMSQLNTPTELDFTTKSGTFIAGPLEVLADKSVPFKPINYVMQPGSLATLCVKGPVSESAIAGEVVSFFTLEPGAGDVVAKGTHGEIVNVVGGKIASQQTMVVE